MRHTSTFFLLACVCVCSVTATGEHDAAAENRQELEDKLEVPYAASNRTYNKTAAPLCHMEILSTESVLFFLPLSATNGLKFLCERIIALCFHMFAF